VRVLVVDPDAHSRAVLMELLARHWSEAQPCGSVADALARLRRDGHDAVVVSASDCGGIPCSDLLPALERAGCGAPWDHALAQLPLLLICPPASLFGQALESAGLPVVAPPRTPRERELFVAAAVRLHFLASRQRAREVPLHSR
jgi:hypothetical protein